MSIEQAFPNRQTMPTDFEYLIIGAGSMGSAAAYHLRVTGDQCCCWSSLKSAMCAAVRTVKAASFAWHDHPVCAVGAGSYGLWAELEQDAGQPLLQRTGGLDMSALQPQP
jgi:glycine/D-amino acid oxidase-like deaminating enzyme